MKNFAIFFLCPSKQFLPISFQTQLLNIFSPKKEGTKTLAAIGYTGKLVTTQI
jgi:hypothetical protein